MHLIDDELRKGYSGMIVSFPIVTRQLAYNALQVGFRVPIAIGTTFWKGYGPCVGINDGTIRVKTMTMSRIVRPVDQVGIQLTWLKARDEKVPVVIGFVSVWAQWNEPRGFNIVYAFVQEKVHLLCVA
jgi:hypothetical protein